MLTIKYNIIYIIDMTCTAVGAELHS